MTTEVAIRSFREDVMEIEGLLKQLPQTNAHNVTHSFCNGVYIRQFTCAAGILGTGKIHTLPCINILLEGTVTVWSETAGRQELRAPFMWTSPAGTKRLFYSHEPLTWLTVHRTDLTDPEEAQSALGSDTYEEYEAKVRIYKGEKL